MCKCSDSEGNILLLWLIPTETETERGVFLGVLARPGIGAAENNSSQLAERNSPATSHPGSSVIDALSILLLIIQKISSGFNTGGFCWHTAEPLASVTDKLAPGLLSIKG